MNKKPRVLWLFKHLGVGGTERLLLELHPHLRDFEFFPAVVSSQPRDLEQDFREADMDVAILGARGHFDFRWLPRFSALRRRIRPDLLHLHNPYPAIGGRLAAAFTGLPTVYTEHNVWSRYHPVSRIGNALTLGLNDRIVAVSHPVQRSIIDSRLGGRLADRVVVIHNGLDVDRVRSEAARGRRLPQPSYGTVGHLRRSKGIDVFLRAARIVQEQLPDAHGLVVGDGEHSRELRSLKDKLGVTSVDFLGVRRDARSLTSQMSVFVLASRQEGLPLALLEAMALGRPIVATTAGGIPDALSNEENAILVPPDDPSALAEGIARLIEDANLGAKLGARAAETVEQRFTAESSALGYAAVYESVLRRA